MSSADQLKLAQRIRGNRNWLTLVFLVLGVIAAAAAIVNDVSLKLRRSICSELALWYRARVRTLASHGLRANCQNHHAAPAAAIGS